MTVIQEWLDLGRRVEELEGELAAATKRANEAEADAKLRGQVIKDCQDQLARWIVPDSGITDYAVLNTLLGILDGSQTREAMRNG